MLDDPDDAAALELERQQQAEYGEYVAKVPIDIGGARAFNPGDPVPKSHVQNDVVPKDQVVRRSTKAGEALTKPEV